MKSKTFPNLRLWRGSLTHEAVTFFLFASLLLQSVQAAAPGWWTSRNVVTAQKPADDYAVLNQGQLKFMASRAWLEMELSLPGGAGVELTQMISGWRLTRPQTDDYAAANIGQLKQVARPFYQRLADAGLLTLPAWISQPGTSGSEDDYRAANLGQAKTLFSFTIPQAISSAPQRLSGNGMAGIGSFPSGYTWGAGPPPLSDHTGLTAPGMPPGSSDSEVSTYPVYAADWAAMQPSHPIIEYQGATGSVSKTNTGNGSSWGGSVSKADGSESVQVNSLSALEGALADLSSLSAPGNQWGLGGWTSTLCGFSMVSSYSRYTYEGQDLGGWWDGAQSQVRAYYQGGVPGGPNRQAWWHVHREIYDQNGLVRREVEYTPCLIGSSAETAQTMSFESKHWGASDEYELAYVSLEVPQILQVNDGDADGDGVPDFADGFNGIVQGVEGVFQACPQRTGRA